MVIKKASRFCLFIFFGLLQEAWNRWMDDGPILPAAAKNGKRDTHGVYSHASRLAFY